MDLNRQVLSTFLEAAAAVDYGHSMIMMAVRICGQIAAVDELLLYSYSYCLP